MRFDPMCNDYEQHVSYVAYSKALKTLALGQPSDETAADLPKADDIRVGNNGPIMIASGNGIALRQATFGFPPKGRGVPVFNFRSEGRKFGESNRCLIPASAFFEFTGVKYPKAKHRFSLRGHPFLAIAGLWREQEGETSFTMLTTEPGPDVAPYHDRQIVVLKPDDWAAWIALSKPEEELLRPLPKRALEVETVRQGSD
jgi:putative SOS response-associated peptidase YedK